MNRPARAAPGVVLLATFALAALAWLLPRWIASDGVRARVASAAADALGRELRFERLELRWLPPELVMIAPVIAASTPGALPLAQAPSLSLHVTAWPLLARRLWIDRLVVEGATLRLEAGALEPAVVVELRELAATLRSDSPEARVRIEASFELARGGRAEARGSVTRAGEIDLAVTLEDVALANVAGYLDAGARLAGAVSGSLALAGPAQSPSRISARLALADGDVQLDEIALRGPLGIEADLAGSLAARSGSFVVDATRAELVLGRSFRKPPGAPATVSGRFVGGPGGALGVDDVKLRVGNPGARQRG